MGKLKTAFNKWRQEVHNPFAEGARQREAHFTSTSGFEPPDLALPNEQELSASGQDKYLAKLGFPGEYPFTRGVNPTMYRGRLWTMRQYAGFGTAAETNARYRYLLESGQTGLSVAFDLPTQMGYDSTHPLAEGEVGRVGVPVDTLEDMRELFANIPLGEVTTSMTINAPAAILLAQYVVLAEEQGVNRRELGGTIQNDILKEYMARGTYIFPPEPSLALTVDTFRFCSREMPRWNMISVSGYHLREAGCSAAQEIAFTLADAVEYCEQAVRAGLDIDSFAGRLSFFFNAHSNLLEEVAKFRAARRMWARIVKERFKARDERSMRLRFHTQTAGSMLMAQQPLNNVVRVTLQALAAVLGGTQSLHTNSYDEALNLPTEESVTIALRTQQIIAEESGVTASTDPLAGGYLIEDITDRLEVEAAKYLRIIDEMGGMKAAIEKGYPQAEIHQKAYEWQQDVEAKRRLLVGHNCYQESDNAGEAEQDKKIPAASPLSSLRSALEAAEQRQRARLEEYLAHRPAYVPRFTEAELERRLDALTRACESHDSISERIIDCVRAGATEGEMVEAMVRVWGRHQESRA
ncbi:MAG: methylmalonyl-CoA mutase [Planctomycetales bacterium 4484_113]|nr:MAG: methylmalonyl-CoA mutase [Planctomycetales bacterium 4484_113]